MGVSPAQIAYTGIVFGALVMAGLRYLPRRKGAARLGGRTPVTSMAASSSGVVREQQAAVVTKMDARLAEHMVRKWQTAKARALGATHSVTHLPEVLEGKMLESWTDRVNEVARNGWYWEYRLVGLNVDSVTVSDNGKKAIVEATFKRQHDCLIVRTRNIKIPIVAHTLQDMNFSMESMTGELQEGLYYVHK